MPSRRKAPDAQGAHTEPPSQAFAVPTCGGWTLHATPSGYVLAENRDAVSGPVDTVAACPDAVPERPDIVVASPPPQSCGLTSSLDSIPAAVRSACATCLVASVTEAADGNLGAALDHARTAEALAEAAGIADVRAQAVWQRGRLAVLAGHVPEALAIFRQATALAATTDRPLRDGGPATAPDVTANGSPDAASSDPPNGMTNSTSVGTANGMANRGANGAADTPDRAGDRGADSVRGRRWTISFLRPFTNQRESSAAGPVGLAVHLLGPLHVVVDDAPMNDLPSGRLRSLLAYLVTHREPCPPKEMLMELFWPESSPASARNNLNVAVHGLRKAFRAVTRTPVIVLADRRYRISPDIDVWLDVSEFEGRVDRARGLDRAGDLVAATREYEAAVAVYRGDFLADDPYEDWPILPREHLRLRHLDALDRLGGLYFGSGRYAASAEVCRRLIEGDPCREEAHRRLMRAYSRQGQPHLALLQFRTCARLLAVELGASVDPSTVALRDRIQRHEPV